MTSSRLQNLELGDYGMKILVIWQDVKLAESNVVIHVVDPLPNALPVPGTYLNYFVDLCNDNICFAPCSDFYSVHLKQLLSLITGSVFKNYTDVVWPATTRTI